MMKGFRSLTILTALLWALTPCACRSQAQMANELKVDSRSTESTARALSDKIQAAVQMANGDLNHQHLHLILGLSTSYFSEDPQGAEAAREIAASLIKYLLIKGDRISAYAWEMDLWQPPQAQRNSVLVTVDNGPAKDRLRDLLPPSPPADSVKGHDTERAIVEITQRHRNAGDAVIVLITNAAASIAPTGGKVIGLNDPRYQKVLQTWKRLEQVNRSGASLELPFQIISGGKVPIKRSLDAVILAPAAFNGAAIEAGSRKERLARSAGADMPDTRGRRVKPLRLFTGILFLFLLVAAVSHWGVAFGIRRPDFLTINGYRYDLSAVTDGKEICCLAGPGSPASDSSQTIVVADPRVPPCRLARFIRKGKGVRVEGMKPFRLHSLDGAITNGQATLRMGNKHRLVFQGECPPTAPGMPPRQMKIPAEVEISRTHPV